jgi:hypothetical protein
MVRLASRVIKLRTITDEQVELVIAKTLAEKGPGQDTHWSTGSMAVATGMSQTAISRIWQAFDLKPTWDLELIEPGVVEVSQSRTGEGDLGIHGRHAAVRRGCQEAVSLLALRVAGTSWLRVTGSTLVGYSIRGHDRGAGLG